MKLNTAQTHVIERYLNSLQLNFQEFYDEMLDHLILETESRMIDSEEDFEKTFATIIAELNKQHYLSMDILTGGSSLRGIKLLERRSYQSRYKEVLIAYRNKMLNNLGSPLWFIPLLLLLWWTSFYDRRFLLELKSYHLVGMGGLSFTLIGQLFQGITLTEMFFRRGAISWFLIQSRISRQKNVELHSVWKCIVFSFGCSLISMTCLGLAGSFSLLVAVLVFIVNLLVLVSAMQLIFEMKQKMIST